MATYYWVGGTGTWDNTSTANWSASSGGAGGAGPPLAADTVNFDANSGTGTVTVATGAVCNVLTHGAANITILLTVNLTATAGTTFTTGTININNCVLTTLSFISTANAARTLNFGASGKLVCTRTTAVSFAVDWYNATTPMTVLGTPLVEFTGNWAAGVTQQFRSQSTAPTNPPSVNIKAGLGTFALGSGFGFKNVDFTGFAGTYLTYGVNIYGNMTLPTGMLTSVGNSSAIVFLASSETQSLTTSGVTLDIPITVGAAGTTNTLRLEDNLTLGSTRAVTLTSGTLDLAGKTLSAQSLATSNSNTRTLAFGTNGVLTLSGTGTAFNAATSTGLSVTGTGTISLTNASTKTFAGGGVTYPIINQAGAGALTISGSNTFTNITNSTQPTTITLTSGTTQTVTNFTASGTSGNLITLNASTAGNRATLTDSGGVNSVSYMDIKDIAATGYGEWQAYTSDGNVDSGNNVGWVFAEPPPLTASEYQISLKSFTERRSF